MSTYVDGNSKKRAFYQTNSRGNERENKTMTRTVEVQFFGASIACMLISTHSLILLVKNVEHTGREAYLYGPPRGQLNHLPGELKIYVDGWHITDVDLEANYALESPDSRNPHFIYHWKGDGADNYHVLRLTLWDDADGVWPWFPIRAFGFDSLIVTSRKRPES
ncbi:hypothetical protein M407DRAFT_21136 [Tulasnella calospora MUT 4182]|nr:hypothetical protein M407DRAFT_21136 [Tulasnella calospora MUT 4182]